MCGWSRLRRCTCAHWGTYVTAAVGNGAASVAARTTVANEGVEAATFEIEQSIVDPDGREIATGAVRTLSLAAGSTGEFSGTLSVPRPRLWSLESPALHRLVTTIRAGGAVVDRYETTFGIRTIRFDPDHGFFLNGRHVEIHGTNNHQDHAGVGVALPDALQAFRVARLKEIGVNAYRCSHNPPTPEFLDACDRLGLLVLDENRLMGTEPGADGPAGEHDPPRPQPPERHHLVARQRGVGDRGQHQGRPHHRLDAGVCTPARPDAPHHRGQQRGLGRHLDSDRFGRLQLHQPVQSRRAAREVPQPARGRHRGGDHARHRGIYFENPSRTHLAFQAQGDTGGNCEKGWNYYAARPFLAGLFFWTGFDYRGEPMPYGWPETYAQFGILDGCGFPKDTAYYLKSWWTDEPVLHLYPHWNWAGKEGQQIDVVCFSNHQAVELFLNGVSLGKKDMPRNGHLEWKVAYAPGALEARGYRGGQVVATTRVETTGAPAQLVLTPDRTAINADGADVAVFTVSAHDAQGRTVPTAANLVNFEITGGRIIGVGNGDPGSHEPDRFTETVAMLPVEDWRGRIAPAGTTMPSAPDSLQPFPRLGNWKAPLPKPGEVYDLSGTITLPTVPAGAGLELVLPAFGGRTTVWLNDRELARDLDTSTVGPALRLDPAQLVAGMNLVQLLVTPFDDKRNHIPELTRLGSMRVTTPAPPAWRSLFSGLAQVIVQSTREPGEIRLTAKSEGLVPAEGTVTARPATLGAAVP